MVSAKPTSVSAAHPLRTQPPGAVPARHRRAHLPVIVHADDFGETVAITDGICLAIEAGVVTSTSVMVNMPGTARRCGGRRNSAAGELRPAPQPLRGQAPHRGPDAPRMRTASSCASGRSPRARSPESCRSPSSRRKSPHRSRAARRRRQGLSSRRPQAPAPTADRLRGGGERIATVWHRASENYTARELARLRGASLLAREIAARHAARVFARARLRSPRARSTCATSSPGDRLAPLADTRADGALPVEICCHPGTRGGGCRQARQPPAQRRARVPPVAASFAWCWRRAARRS